MFILRLAPVFMLFTATQRVNHCSPRSGQCQSLLSLF